MSKTDALLDSIWSTVEKANDSSLQKTRLSKDYIAFAESEKPFIRTDKGTVKRRATLAVYEDYVERFYNSRGEDIGDFTVDSTSTETIVNSVRHILGSLLPNVLEASLDTDVFSLGLDSLNVFQAIKIIQTAMDLQDQLAPRHLYANPTIMKFSAVIAKLSTNAKSTKRQDNGASADDNQLKIQKLIEEHKSRQSFKLNAFDYVNPYVSHSDSTSTRDKLISNPAIIIWD